MKRTLALLAVLMLALSMLAACGGQQTPASTPAPQGDTEQPAEATPAPAESSGDKIKVEFWTHVNEAWNREYQREVGEFNASQDQYELVATHFPYDEFEAKMQTSLMSGSAGADIYECWGGWALDFIAAGALSPVPDHLIGDLKSDSYEPVLGGFDGGDGKFYGVPIEFNNEYGGLVINKTLFDEAGVSYNFATWDDMINTAKQFAEGEGDNMAMRGFDFCTSDNLPALWTSMILQSGGQYIQDGKIAFGNNPIATQTMDVLVGYVNTDKITSAAPLAGGDNDGHNLVCQDVSMMVMRGPWVIPDCEASWDRVFGEDIDFVEMPWYNPANKAFVAETGWGLCVDKNSQAADGAWTFAEFFLEPENLIKHNAACGQIPPRKSVAENPQYVEMLPYAAPIVAILDYGKYIGSFNADVFKANIVECFLGLVNGTYASTDEALVQLDEKMNADLKLG